MKIVIHCETGFAGMEDWQFWEVPDTTAVDELDELAWRCALENAETYDLYNLHEYLEYGDPLEDLDPDKYVDSIEGWWEPYEPEVHDGYAVGSVITWNRY